MWDLRRDLSYGRDLDCGQRRLRLNPHSADEKPPVMPGDFCWAFVRSCLEFVDVGQIELRDPMQRDQAHDDRQDNRADDTCGNR